MQELRRLIAPLLVAGPIWYLAEVPFMAVVCYVVAVVLLIAGLVRRSSTTTPS